MISILTTNTLYRAEKGRFSTLSILSDLAVCRLRERPVLFHGLQMFFLSAERPVMHISMAQFFLFSNNGLGYPSKRFLIFGQGT